MSALEVRRLGYALGAEIRGVDASNDLSDETVAAIRKAVLEHVVVCLPGQDLEPGEFSAFAAKFGPLDDNRAEVFRRNPADHGMIVIANKPVDVAGMKTGGKPTLADTWHTDNSFSDHPATLTFLGARDLPDIGGNTMFANTGAAYDALSPAYKDLIESLEGVFDYKLGHAYQSATPDEQAIFRASKPTSVHRIARVHPETGRKALYLSDRIRNFVGMNEEETRPIVAYLIAHATRPEFTYRHVWTKHDLVMWDQRCSLHYAIGDYDPTQLRRMFRASLLGSRSGRLFEEPSATVAAG